MKTANYWITAFLGLLAMATWGYTGWQARYQWTVPPTYIAISVMITVCASLGWVLITITAIRRDEYTRCRKCDHILRGLSEPRCPECGTEI